MNYKRTAYVHTIHVQFYASRCMRPLPLAGQQRAFRLTLKEKSRFSVVKLFIQTECYKISLSYCLPGTILYVLNYHVYTFHFIM